MLSAAAAALLTAGVSAAFADTEISSNTSTALNTTSSGSITIDTNGSVSAPSTSTPAITINSNNFVLNNGIIQNNGQDSAIGVEIDTTAASLFPASTGFASTGTIDVSGAGTSKRGLWITGGHTFYGPITLTTLTTTTLTTTTASQSSSMLVKGDSSAAILLDSGTSVTSNMLIAGGGIIQNASDNSTQSNSIVIFLNGTLNGNFINTATISAIGPGTIGIETLGGIHSCASDTAAPSGFTCPASSNGAFINTGTISLIGTSTYSSRGNNPEAGSAVVIGGSIDGGFLNSGPGTSSNLSAGVISSSGIIASGIVNPTVLIDPSKSITGTLTAPRASVVLGPLGADIDPTDPGYSFTNRGTISAQATDPGLSTAAMVIQGTSSVFTACLSSVSGSCDITTHTVTQNVTAANGSATSVTYQSGGGILNTGTLSAVATTNQTSGTSSNVSTTALAIGDYAIVPRIDVKAETISGASKTPGIIEAQISGLGTGSAVAIAMGTNANVPVINVGQGATVLASVSTNTLSPTKDIATASSPFTLYAAAIVDSSGTLKTVNNAGVIQATTSVLTPQTGATVLNVNRAIDLSSSTTGGAVINNSGKILGDVLFGSAGNSDVLNVGNVGTGGTANAATGVVNTPTNYAVIAETITNQTTGQPPNTTASVINFGSGNSHTLHVGSYGYVNADIVSGSGALNVQVDSNGLLYLANSSSSLQADQFVIANNGTLGLTIAQANLDSLTPVVQANSATLSGANLSLVFGSYIASGTTAADAVSPSAQTITLVRSPTIVDTTLATQNAQLGQNTPFLFESPASAGVVSGDKGPTPLTLSTDSTGEQVLLLHLQPRSVNATNADGSPGLNLSGDARNEFPFATRALSNDNELGAAVATSMTVYNTAGVPSSGINVAASQQQAQQVFSQFAPDVSGGTREIAIMLTDQATGPVAARQRLLRDYSTVAGEITLWGQEFAGHINNKGKPDGANELTSYKDHGFGFSLGVDAGSPRNGWYGGAFTFYSGDVSQILPRATKTQTEWYMLTGYTNWTGKHLFVESHLDVAYGNFEETRTLTVGNYVRQATSKRPGVMLAGGVNSGLITHMLGGRVEVDPHVSLDGLTLREEGYSEANGGAGFNLQVAPYFANSLRTAVGVDTKTDISVFGIDLSPNARVGYRYDLLHQAVKIKAAFLSTGGLGTAGNTMTFVGPDPDTGNYFFGLGLGAGTDTWKIGIDYDWVRGNNASTTQVGTLHVLGRI